jgi:hypothetical protein
MEANIFSHQRKVVEIFLYPPAKKITPFQLQRKNSHFKCMRAEVEWKG